MNGHRDAYRPPAPGERPGPAPSRAARTFGILSIIFGALTALFGVMQAVSPVLGRMWMGFLRQMESRSGVGGHEADRMFRAMGEMYDIMASATWAYVVTALILLVFSIALIVIGIGQCRFRRWAAAASVRWAVAALAALAVMVALDLTVIGPTTREAMARVWEEMPRDAGFPGGIFGTFTWIASIGKVIWTIVYYAPYPIILLVAFRRPSVVASMTN